MRKKMTKLNNSTKPQFTVPINKYVLKLIEDRFNGKHILNFNGKNLKKDNVVYLCFLLTKLQVRAVKNGGSAFTLYSKSLKTNFIYDYKKYLVFLEKENILLCHKEHNTFSGLSRIYSIDDFSSSLPVSQNVSIKVVRYLITNNIILKKINFENSSPLIKETLQKNKYCEETRNHLVKSFNEYLEIDTDGAYSQISNQRVVKYSKNSLTIEEFYGKKWRYSIKKETDNRLHTIITRINKSLLKFVTYKNNRLGEIDIKTSQPLFLFIVLNSIFNTTVNSKLKTFLKDKLGKDLQKKLIENGIDKEELKEFGKIILEGDLYKYLITKIEIQKNSHGKYYYKKYDKKRKTHITVQFKSKRELMKKATLRAMYGGRGDIVNDIHKIFPSIKIIINLINNEKGLSTTKNHLSNVLQNLEAYIVLDLIAKDVSDKFKEIPLLSKHDSLITYANSIEEVKEFMTTKFKEYTGIDGRSVLVCESW
jgi:hypothetical protein